MRGFLHSIIAYLNSSILRKLMLCYVLIMMVPVMAMGTYIRKQTEDYHYQRMFSLAEEYVNQAIGEIKKKTYQYEYIAQMIQGNTSVKRLLDTESTLEGYEKISTIDSVARDFLRNFRIIDPSIYKVRVFYTKGQLFEVSNFFYDYSRVREKDWYSEFMSSRIINETGWNVSHKNEKFDIDLERETATDVVSVLMKIYDNMYDEVIGLVEIQIKHEDFFGKLVNIQSDGIMPEAVVIGDDGNIEYSKFKDGAELGNIDWKEVIKDASGFLENLPPWVKKGFYITTRRIDRDLQQAFDDTEQYWKQGCTVVYFFPLDEMNEEILQNRNFIFLVLLMAVVFLTFVTFLLVRLVLSKLKKLLSALKRIQEGDLEFTLEAGQNDEVGELARNFNIMTKRVMELIRINVDTRLAQKEAQLKALQAQINPHFLYNSLNNIKMMAEIKDELDISDAISSLGIILRYNLSGGDNELTTLGAELRYIRHYISIQKLLLEDRADITVTVDPWLLDKLDECVMMKLLIQPVLENAIVHGLKDVSVNGQVNINVCKMDDDLHIKVTNNGNVIPREKLKELNASLQEEHVAPRAHEKGFGIGLKNVQQRIKLLYGEKYGIVISSSEKAGTEVHIGIPYITDKVRLSLRLG